MSVLLAGARHYGQYCKAQNDAFMYCKYDKKDPAKCVEEGKKVTACGIEFFQKLKDNCNAEFTAHWQCLDTSNQENWKCRKTQKAFDDCVFQKMGLSGDYNDVLP
ncbi:NADH dehydrogenase (ubiquinone) 1 alpha subcomplex 8 [Sphaeroforma arctica JP610]|uniref:NADH dehydrogenase (Ubiquinone) 1 alpha subcomplex 8 n=1 Tax=Sphaeroforma arctica JP610 TaxID=667725 RepID=A0A0L0G848_9EUKA|nr:NADH dehydrogenase (ubiquinone) 1 alpha subcomplex 8 [Sphaeroforma arctica JP610]KNC85175.1 NADH dehydrogenase (ubiquinone) 1 alpha subcomplex 8 [Sphaeroforma arctica JP610]|eukprot:XP_014159077.1 NADH dehydrogenase (ubiquinone) 1 alpha subcomplex 8 [Sphaeroforma arctica JP610]